VARLNQLRVIGGRLRGRKLSFPDVDGLRPTPDRVRETLFNWLAPQLAGARCLDLFAGSGALGFEALSRGAGQVTFVERNADAVRQIRQNLELLGATGGRIEHADALIWTGTVPAQPFHIVFLDPPFAGGLVADALARLSAAGWLTADARVYVESEAPLELPSGWSILRDKTAGQVRYRLLSRQDIAS